AGSFAAGPGPAAAPRRGRDRLLPGPDFRADLRSGGVGPQGLPLVGLFAVERKPGVAARRIGDGEEVVVSDGGAAVLRAADIPGDLEGVAGLLDVDGPRVARSTRIRALDVIL